jgi:hypothetical protein
MNPERQLNSISERWVVRLAGRPRVRRSSALLQLQRVRSLRCSLRVSERYHPCSGSRHRRRAGRLCRKLRLRSQTARLPPGKQPVWPIFELQGQLLRTLKVPKKQLHRNRRMSLRLTGKGSRP